MRDQVAAIVRRKLDSVEESDFQLLRRIPSSESKRFLRFYQKLPHSARDEYKHVASVMACGWFGIPLDPVSDGSAIESWKQFGDARMRDVTWEDWGVRGLRTLRGMRDTKLTEADFSSLPPEAIRKIDTVETAKAPQLKRSAKAIFRERMNAIVETHHGRVLHRGRIGQTDVITLLDFGSSFTQMVYEVRLPTMFVQRRGFTYEGVLGFGLGRWDFIEEGLHQEAMTVLCDAVEALVSLGQEIVRVR